MDNRAELRSTPCPRLTLSHATRTMDHDSGVMFHRLFELSPSVRGGYNQALRLLCEVGDTLRVGWLFFARAHTIHIHAYEKINGSIDFT